MRPAVSPETQAARAASGQAPITEQYQRRIRQAITPDEVRRACSAPNGSLTIGEEIIVCAERDPQQRYRVPREVAISSREEDTKSPVQRGREVMTAGDGGPVGNTADLGGTGFNPLMLGVFGYKVIEKVIENAQEE